MFPQALHPPAEAPREWGCTPRGRSGVEAFPPPEPEMEIRKYLRIIENIDQNKADIHDLLSNSEPEVVRRLAYDLWHGVVPDGIEMQSALRLLSAFLAQYLAEQAVTCSECGIQDPSVEVCSGVVLCSNCQEEE